MEKYFIRVAMVTGGMKKASEGFQKHIVKRRKRLKCNHVCLPVGV